MKNVNVKIINSENNEEIINTEIDASLIFADFDNEYEQAQLNFKFDFDTDFIPLDFFEHTVILTIDDVEFKIENLIAYYSNRYNYRFYTYDFDIAQEIKDVSEALSA